FRVEEEQAWLLGGECVARSSDGNRHSDVVTGSATLLNLCRLGLLGRHDKNHALDLVEVRPELGEAHLATDAVSAPVVPVEDDRLLLGTGRHDSNRLAQGGELDADVEVEEVPAFDLVLAQAPELAGRARPLRDAEVGVDDDDRLPDAP